MWVAALVSGRLFRDYLRGADVPSSDPIHLPYKHVKFAWYEKRSPSVGNTGIPWFIMVYHGLSWFIMVYHGLSWFTMVYHGLSWFIMVYHGLPWFTMVYHGLSWFIMVYHGLSWFIMVYQGLSGFIIDPMLIAVDAVDCNAFPGCTAMRSSAAF